MTKSDLTGIEIDDLTGDMKVFAESAGLDATLTLLRCFAGGTVYVPQAKNIIREKRDNSIRARFNGSNYAELSRVFNLSIRQIRNITAMRKEG